MLHLFKYFFYFIFSLSLYATTYTTDLTDIIVDKDKTTVQSTETLFLNVNLTHKKNWHSYWINPGDSGIKTTFKWYLPTGFRALTPLFPEPMVFQLGSLVNFGYKENVDIVIPIAINDSVLNGEYNLNAEISWLVCDDICIPEKVTISEPILISSKTLFSKQSTAIQDRIIKRKFNVVEALYIIKPGKVMINIPLNKNNIGSNAYFFPEQLNIFNYQASQLMEITKDGIRLTVPTQANPDRPISGLLTFDDKATLYVKATQESTDLNWLPIIYAIVFAFIGGILLNIMPCVFPILSLKVMSILDKTAAEQLTVKRQAKAYTLGVVSTFTVIASLLIILKALGHQLGWGFQLQNPVFVMLLAIVMLAVAMHFNNLLKLPTWLSMLPAYVSNTHYKLTAENRFKDFFTGVLAVIVATPCTAPFMATAIGFAITQPYIIMLTIFIVLGIGFSFPFLLIAYIPYVQQLLPKPGKWMVTLKHILAIPVYVTVIWLMWVVEKQVGAAAWLLTVFMVINLACISLLQPIQNKITKVLVPSLLILLIWITTQIGALKSSDVDFNLSTFNQLMELTNQQEKVFVDVTAAWCVTCQLNEQTVLHTNEITQLFKNQDITLLTLDWTDYDENITSYLQSFDRAGVPLYVYYDSKKNVTILPQLLTKKIIKKIVSED